MGDYGVAGDYQVVTIEIEQFCCIPQFEL